VTVASFVGLAEGTIVNDAFGAGTFFFDGTPFHRVVPGHVIQGGRPVSERAVGPGYTLPNEIRPELDHGRAGMVGMANGGPHTATCQFYITLGDRSYLDGDYTVFGQVVAGMDVVEAVEQGDVIETVRIVRVGTDALAFRPTTETFHHRREALADRVRATEAEVRREKETYLHLMWPHAVTAETGWRHLVLAGGSGPVGVPGDTLRVRYTGRTISGRVFASSGDRGAPAHRSPSAEEGEVFPFVVGEGGVNRGLDEAVTAMRRGEKRLVIVPPELGYDPVGYYGPEPTGEPRFVIRPRSFLIYEVEVMRGRPGSDRPRGR
jgi:peptidylprolyl isomerase